MWKMMKKMNPFQRLLKTKDIITLQLFSIRNSYVHNSQPTFYLFNLQFSLRHSKWKCRKVEEIFRFPNPMIYNKHNANIWNGCCAVECWNCIALNGVTGWYSRDIEQKYKKQFIWFRLKCVRKMKHILFACVQCTMPKILFLSHFFSRFV